MQVAHGCSRREFVRTLGAASAVTAGGLVLAGPGFGQAPPAPVETNVGDFMKVPRTSRSLPGPFPGKVVKVTDARSLVDEKFDGKVIAEMFRKGLSTLTGKDPKDSFRLLIDPKDVVGIKVNPVGPPLINTHVEVVDAVVAWLVDNGIPKANIVIWDRFDYMLTDAGYTKERFPGIAIEGLQTMDENGNKWRGPDGRHVSIDNFDKDAYYFVKGVVGKGVRGYKDDEFYLNQHVFDGEYSYFGKLLTKRLTRIINVAAYKNTGASISMATKNMGYGSLCNVGRLHAPLGLKASTEVMASPVLRDKLALNITDGLRGQYDGGPDKDAQFVYANHSLYFATDPFALDMLCHKEINAKRKEKGAPVNESPRITEYLRYAETLGLGVVADDKMQVVRV
ncbi:MAG: hypothetical protein H6Q10_228 [Acidobacteria bacterium]|nr:hypothetical protein [Acidobacteriota bacterium]